ncbi:FecR domain-containing protein [Thermomonas flagellata]|uniref:FecR domain-containing protein n=1 Tax=Thermomonas flagellata TaxID=2888524 RepID=UPI001F046050|nr:FecR domain-containing protein [Thermomonas flagellata]
MPPHAPAPSRPRLQRLTALLLGLALLLAMLAAPAADWSYRVRPGDTVWDLARRYLRADIPWQQLQAHNRIADPARLAPGSVLRIPVEWLKLQPAPATVLGVRGQASFERPGRPPQPVVAGMQVGMGLLLRTGAGASLTLRFADGSELLLQENSALALDRLGAYGRSGMVDTRLRLLQGRVSNQVNKLRRGSSFSIQTPALTSSVRGTRFRVAQDAAGARTEVSEGLVQAQDARDRVQLQAGQGVASRGPRSPLAAQALLPAPAGLAVDAGQRPIRLRWQAVPGAARYRVEVGGTPAFPYLLLDTVVDAPELAIAALPDGAQRFRVRAIAADGLEGLDAEAELPVQLPAPFALAPADGAELDMERPRLRWSSVGTDARYRLQLAAADDPGFARPLQDVQALPATDWRPAQALAPGAYLWRIATLDQEGRQSAWTVSRLTLLPPGAPPQPGVAGRGDTLELRWPEGRPGQRFRVQVAAAPDFSQPRLDTVVAQNRLPLTNLPSGRWHARVQVIDADGEARPFGPAQTFQTGCRACRWWLLGGGALLVWAL